LYAVRRPPSRHHRRRARARGRLHARASRGAPLSAQGVRHVQRSSFRRRFHRARRIACGVREGRCEALRSTMNACKHSWLVAMLVVFATACSKPEEPRPAEATVHGVTVRAPTGWSVIDEKQQVVIKPPPLSDVELRELDRGGRISTKSNAAVRVRDLGPVTPAGMQHAVAVVRETWRSGRAAEAKVLLFKVPLRSELVPWLAPPSDFARA